MKTIKGFKGFNKDMNGEKIKADVWYKLEDGKFKEVN